MIMIIIMTNKISKNNFHTKKSFCLSLLLEVSSSVGKNKWGLVDKIIELLLIC